MPQRLEASTRQKCPGAVWTYCVVHGQTLDSEDFCQALENVLQAIINVANYINTRPVNSRTSARFFEDMDTKHSALLTVKITGTRKGFNATF
jgi:hypothetical protein